MHCIAGNLKIIEISLSFCPSIHLSCQSLVLLSLACRTKLHLQIGLVPVLNSFLILKGFYQRAEQHAPGHGQMDLQPVRATKHDLKPSESCAE